MKDEPKVPQQLTPEELEQVEAAGAVPGEPEEAPPGRMKMDLHCHSEASHDCVTPLESFVVRCGARGIDVQAITDHNEIWGGQKLKDIVAQQNAGLTVIVGEEVTTKEGEIIGLFLDEKIPAGLTPEETVERIKAQGGLVLIPHGFDPLKRWRLRPEALKRIADDVDIVETFNARISRPRWNREAVRWAEARGVMMSAGSDAHTLKDVGSAWVEVPKREIKGPQDLLKALQGGVPVGEWTHPAIAFVYKMFYRTRRRFRRG